LILSPVYGLNKEGVEGVESGKKFQVLEIPALVLITIFHCKHFKAKTLLFPVHQ